MSLLPSSPLPRPWPRPRQPSPTQPQQNNRRQLLLLLYRSSFMIGITYFTVHNYLNLIPAASTLIYNTNYIIPNGDNGSTTPFVGTRNNNNTIVESSTNTNTAQTNTAQTKTKNTATTAITTNYDASSSSISDVKFVNIADDFDLPSAASQLVSSSESSSLQSNNTNSNNRLDCGKKKCFISSIAYPNDLGYLVGNYKDSEKQLIKFIKAWEFTKWIDTQQFNSDKSSNSKQERRYHFYSKERPTIVELNNTTLQKLNSVVYHTNQKTYSPEFYTTSKVAIQKVHKVTIKNEMLFFGCFSHNYDRYLEEKNKFFLKNNNNHNNNNNVVGVNSNTTTNTNNFFSNNLIESIQIMKRLLKLQPKMLTDFQVLFDSNGYVYFLDIEAQYELTARWKIGLKEKQQDCLQKIDDILK